MGGAPMLLLVAMAGVIYGWQPDDRGGVEYIIEIPPDQLHEIEQFGEISSVIDPAVAGHVSRIVVRVGTDPVPKTTPPGLSRHASSRPADGQIVIADHTPVPIPQMSDVRQAIPIPSVDRAATGFPTNESKPDSASVRKPAPDDPQSSPGFSLPSSLRNAATDAMNNVAGGLNQINQDLNRSADVGSSAAGQMGSALQNGQGSTTTNAISAADAARRLQANNNAPNQPPPFTGNAPSGTFAQTRTSGPSTDPASPRDNSWYNLGGARQSGPSTDPVNQAADPRGAFAAGPPDPRTTSGMQSLGNMGSGPATQNAAQARGPNYSNPNPETPAGGLGTTSTFGRLPGGMSLPNSGRDLRSEQLAAERAASGATTFAPVQGSTTTNDPYGYGQRTLAQQPSLNGYNANSSPYGSLDRNDSSGLGFGTSFGASNVNGQSLNTQQGNAFAPRTQLNPIDPNLTAAQSAALPPGAWTVDAYGRPVDRDGRLLDQFGRPINSTNITQTPLASGVSTGQSELPRSSLGQPNLPQPPNLGGGYTATDSRNQYSGYNPSAQGDVRIAAANQEPYRERSLTTSPIATNPPSLSDRPMSTSRSSFISPTPQALTAQPLFNGLLLISFVANIYLVFWLKNLRHQFRDLVTAKRITGSSSTAT